MKPKAKNQNSKIVIAHLYTQEMNIYGDRGNVLTLVKRLEWRGYQVNIVQVGVGDKFDFTTADIVFGGGGQDRGQVAVGKDLHLRADNLRQAAKDGVVMLTICGTYQLFGRGFTTLEGQVIPGIGIFKTATIGSTHRMIGNIIVDSAWGQLVGFENHSGETVLDASQKPLGKVVRGFGNNFTSGAEGAVINNVFGTYLHGPILPKNPKFADHLILTTLKRRGVDSIQPLDDSLELQAAEVAITRPQ